MNLFASRPQRLNDVLFAAVFATAAASTAYLGVVGAAPQAQPVESVGAAAPLRLAFEPVLITAPRPAAAVHDASAAPAFVLPQVIIVGRRSDLSPAGVARAAATDTNS